MIYMYFDMNYHEVNVNHCFHIMQAILHIMNDHKMETCRCFTPSQGTFM